VQQDTLTSLLEAVHLNVSSAKVSHIRFPWSFHVDKGMPSFYMILSGRCGIRFDGPENSITLTGGTMAIVLNNAHTIHHVTRDEKHTKEVPLQTILLSGRFTWDRKNCSNGLPELPAIIQISIGHECQIPWVISTIKMIEEESAAGKPGAQAVIDVLAELALVQGIRSHLSSIPKNSNQSIDSIKDRHVRTALYLIHEHPEEPWTLNLLAKRCGMSRSAFAEHFRITVGIPPMEYLQKLRMEYACDLLAENDLPIKSISGKTGYSSQTAFNAAFKRWSGVAPSAYRKTHSQPRKEGTSPYASPLTGRAEPVL
jgi:AraC-like DNA-binding protein